MTEAEFQRKVLDLARVGGWRFVHFRPAFNRRGQASTPIEGDPGFPDVVLVHPTRAGVASFGRLLFVELKSDTGWLSDVQVGWIAWLRAAGQDARVWRPSDWPEVVSTLTPGAVAVGAVRTHGRSSGGFVRDDS